jgi:hypothetical protein
MDPIEAALSFLSSLEPEETPNYTQIAKKSGCDRSTLSKRHRGVQGSKREQYEWLQLLTPEQEKYLVKYIDTLSKRALPPSKSMICNFAREISKKEVGKRWIDRFIERQDLDLILKWSQGMDKERH